MAKRPTTTTVCDQCGKEGLERGMWLALTLTDTRSSRLNVFHLDFCGEVCRQVWKQTHTEDGTS